LTLAIEADTLAFAQGERDPLLGRTSKQSQAVRARLKDDQGPAQISSVSTAAPALTSIGVAKEARQKDYSRFASCLLRQV